MYKFCWVNISWIALMTLLSFIIQRPIATLLFSVSEILVHLVISLVWGEICSIFSIIIHSFIHASYSQIHLTSFLILIKRNIHEGVSWQSLSQMVFPSLTYPICSSTARLVLAVLKAFFSESLPLLCISFLIFLFLLHFLPDQTSLSCCFNLISAYFKINLAFFLYFFCLLILLPPLPICNKSARFPLKFTFFREAMMLAPLYSVSRMTILGPWYLR